MAVVPRRASDQAHPGAGEPKPAFRAEGGEEGRAPAVPQPELGQMGAAGGLRGSPSLAARGRQGGWGCGGFTGWGPPWRGAGALEGSALRREGV